MKVNEIEIVDSEEISRSLEMALYPMCCIGEHTVEEIEAALNTSVKNTIQAMVNAGRETIKRKTGVKTKVFVDDNDAKTVADAVAMEVSKNAARLSADS